MKPMLYVINTDEAGAIAADSQVVLDAPSVSVCAQLEAELADMAKEDADEYMKDLGMKESGLDKIIVAGYALLDLITFFTSGVQETRAWTTKKGTSGPLAAGVIHTDFIKGYIKADVARWQDFVDCGGWGGAKRIWKSSP